MCAHLSLCVSVSLSLCLCVCVCFGLYHMFLRFQRAFTYLFFLDIAQSVTELADIVKDIAMLVVDQVIVPPDAI